MKILVLSDSHSSLRFMRQCLDKIAPDCMIHLGDYFDDAEAIHEEYCSVPLLQVPGNCDRYRCSSRTQEILVETLDGVTIYMTHGHLHGVKQDTGRLILDARAAGAQAVLYGHTHVADCRQEDGLWILNPGSCGYGGGSAGLIDTQDGMILRCRILRQEDLEEIE